MGTETTRTFREKVTDICISNGCISGGAIELLSGSYGSKHTKLCAMKKRGETEKERGLTRLTLARAREIDGTGGGYPLGTQNTSTGEADENGNPGTPNAPRGAPDAERAESEAGRKPGNPEDAGTGNPPRETGKGGDGNPEKTWAGTLGADGSPPGRANAPREAPHAKRAEDTRRRSLSKDPSRTERLCLGSEALAILTEAGADGRLVPSSEIKQSWNGDKKNVSRSAALWTLPLPDGPLTIYAFGEHAGWDRAGETAYLSAQGAYLRQPGRSRALAYVRPGESEAFGELAGKTRDTWQKDPGQLWSELLVVPLTKEGIEITKLILGKGAKEKLAGMLPDTAGEDGNPASHNFLWPDVRALGRFLGGAALTGETCAVHCWDGMAGMIAREAPDASVYGYDVMEVAEALRETGK